MIAARRRATALICLALLAAALLAGLARVRDTFTPPPNRPTLLLLTGLPLLFSEDFSLEGSGSPAWDMLQANFHVLPISASSEADLAKGNLLLMAQPQAQSPDDLVALDRWVRRGGRVLLLADPMLEWPSRLPLGDPTRAPPTFVDTGLLAHWGLRLEAPAVRGPARRELGGMMILTVSPGALFGRCIISSDRLVARCPIGKGKAMVVADADFLNVGELGQSAGKNLEGLRRELAGAASW